MGQEIEDIQAFAKTIKRKKARDRFVDYEIRKMGIGDPLPFTIDYTFIVLEQYRNAHPCINANFEKIKKFLKIMDGYNFMQGKAPRTKISVGIRIVCDMTPREVHEITNVSQDTISWLVNSVFKYFDVRK